MLTPNALSLLCQYGCRMSLTTYLVPRENDILQKQTYPPPFVHPKEKKPNKHIASNTCDIQANTTGSLFFKGPEGPKELTVFLMG